MTSIKNYILSLTPDTNQKKKILILLESEIKLGLNIELLDQLSEMQLNELWNWLIVRNDDQRNSHLKKIKNRLITIKQKIKTIEKKLQIQIIKFEETADCVGENDVEDLLNNL